MYIKLNLLLYLTRSQFGVTNVKNLRAIRLFIVIKGLLIIYSCVITLKLKVRLGQFKTLQDFQEWKGDIEKATICNYVRLRGKKTSASSGKQTFYYNCNRTGKLPCSKKGENKVANKKLPKSQGSCKLNKSCVSYIKLVKENGKEIVAVWQKMHYGHENEIQHIRLSQADPNAVASKLAAGVPKARWNVDQINT
ncbi:hypothetical protein NQ314_015004 [Rhamnusium bicolor]|uniref:Uncharacterized protein n=1 Tax=Rhamnusium bicolor TaxID=1586634 RepID=A0AAV8X0G8_9CUCU|nr:hypothetical protein NQ314_015004 [Rhamnusium bicolor]